MLVEPTAGLVIAGKYELLERIGSGGMSEIYRAENLLIGRTVALKLLSPELARNRESAARFFQEAQSVSQLRHPGLVDVLDAGQGETGPFIVMEFLEGETVAAALARHGRLPLAAALATVLPILDALDVVHRAGVIHRDLKPENVFYAIDPQSSVTVKLLDFGIAKVLWPAGPTPRTSTGVIFGTPDYLSPEQAAGEPVLDARSDLFSLGVVLYELLTGVRPFRAPTTVATAYRIAHARAPSLQENGGPAVPTLDAILARAMAKRPDERHASAAELAAELRCLVTSEATLVAALASTVKARREPQTSGVHPRASVPSQRASGNPGAGQSSKPTRRASGRTDRGDTLPSLPHQVPPKVVSAPPARSENPRSRAPDTPPLSTPDRLAGRCHLRGLVLRSVDRHVLEELGDAVHVGAIDAIEGPAADDLRSHSVQSIVFYDLRAFTAYVTHVTRQVARGNANWIAEAGRRAVATDLATVLKNAVRPDRPLPVVRRVVPVLSRLFDFGLWEVVPGERQIRIAVADFEAAPAELRLWLLGVICATLDAAGAAQHVTISRGDAAFAPQLSLDISPRS